MNCVLCFPSTRIGLDRTRYFCVLRVWGCFRGGESEPIVSICAIALASETAWCVSWLETERGWHGGQRIYDWRDSSKWPGGGVFSFLDSSPVRWYYWPFYIYNRLFVGSCFWVSTDQLVKINVARWNAQYTKLDCLEAARGQRQLES